MIGDGLSGLVAVTGRFLLEVTRSSACQTLGGGLEQPCPGSLFEAGLGYKHLSSTTLTCIHSESSQIFRNVYASRSGYSQTSSVLLQGRHIVASVSTLNRVASSASEVAPPSLYQERLVRFKMAPAENDKYGQAPGMDLASLM